MWSSRPVARILIFYVIGIIICSYITNISYLSYYIIATSSILLLSAGILISKQLQHILSWIIGLLLGTTIILLGVLNMTDDESINVSIDLEKEKILIANIIEPPVIGKNSVKTLVEAEFPRDSTFVKSVKVMCYFELCDSSKNLEYGDNLIIHSKLAIPQKPMNPYEFDYQSYLKTKGIVYSSYIAEGNWKTIGNNPESQFISISNKIRKYLLNILKQNGLEGETYSIAAAILLGYDEAMVPELRNDFIMAGAMHILCVSGLHVGIIYLVFNFLFGVLNNNRRNNIIKAILLLLIVWSYATITGLSPSIQRAGLMISAFIIAKLLNRKQDSYNTLASSALLLLLIEPNLIFNVGFQLSYAAVIGIITFHQPIYNLLHIKNRIIDGIWSITVLSFSAQLATFPIAIYYFHFFPPWFWLTNLATFPLSFLIIVTGLLTISLSWVPIISGLMGKVLALLVISLVYSVGIVKHLPFSGIHNIYTSPVMIFTLYLLIISVYVMFVKKKIKLLKVVVLLSFIMMSLTIIQRYKVANQKRMVVYCINNKAVYEFIDGSNQIILTDSSLITSSSKLDYHIGNSRAYWGLGSNIGTIPDYDTIYSGIVSIVDNFMRFEDKIIYINNSPKLFQEIRPKIPVDILMISGRKNTSLEKLGKFITYEKVIIDPTVPPWKSKKIRKYCNENKIDYHDIKKSGALVIDIAKTN